MDVEDMSLEDKCEHLMNVVVESRKRFGKMCIDYEQKSSIVENKMLNDQIKIISSYRFKSKNTIPDIDVEEMTKEIDEFKNEIINNQKRTDNLRQNVKKTLNVVQQLKVDGIGQRLRKPISAEAMLADSKNRMKLNAKNETNE